MIKLAGMEDTGLTDSKTGKKIRISTTTRLIYRKTYPAEYGELRNQRLNQLIAEDFVKASGSVVHYFRLGDKGSRTDYKPEGAEEGKVYANVAEIRGTSASFFVSSVRESYIDILTIQNSWKKPRYQGSKNNPIALGDS